MLEKIKSTDKLNIEGVLKKIAEERSILHRTRVLTEFETVIIEKETNLAAG